MSGEGAARRISLVATAATAAGAAVILALAAGSVHGAREHAAGAEARMAASLHEAPGVTEADVAEFLEGRGRILPATSGGPGPGAFAYRAGALEPDAWIAVEPASGGSGWPWAASALALFGVVAMFAWAAARRGAPPPARFPVAAALLAATLFALVAVVAGRWEESELAATSRAHLDRGLAAVGLARGGGAGPEEAARVAGLPWANDAALDEPDRLWTMPREVGAAMAAAPALRSAGRFTVTVSGAVHHGGSLPLGPDSPAGAAASDRPATLHLVFLGYEESASAAVARTAAAAGSALVVSLVLFLLPLAARPRALARTLAAWGFLAPAGALLLLFTFGPLLFSLWISLHDWHLVDPAHPFTGLENYRSVLGDGAWWAAIRNTAVFTLHVPFAMAVALGLALLTRQSRRAIRWARLALFLPSITSVVAIAVVWKWLLNDGYGLVNRALAAVGIAPVAWLSSPNSALVSLMVISVWMVVGYQMVVFQAGLAAIPRDWYDAARVDGASRWQRFCHITLPGLRHTLFFVLVTSVIGSFQVFGLVYVMTEGGPLGATDVAVYHIYREAWEFLRFGDAAAMSWVLFGVVFAATWLHFRLLERRGAHA